MKKKLNKIIIVICEGGSEVAYLQLLNRFLREQECALRFVARNAESGIFKFVQKKYREERRRNKNGTFIVWVDDDLYVGNRNDTDKACATQFEALPPNVKKIFKFSRHNLEDFLASHLQDDVFEMWKSVCIQHNHFITPMFEEEALPLIREHLFPNYKKGECPFEELTKEKLELLFSHNKEPFKSSFADFLEGILREITGD